MIITRTSPLTGVVHQMDLDVTVDQLNRFDNRHATRELIQNIFPHLTAAEREFILSGYTQADWDAMFPPEDDDV